ncbi:MAG: hypothetical protein U0L18_01405 [Acutalibacteraceae bacterium]|jgi:hypothetical protein|nr:hypothetical protein [Acutalibacteraceae bacterium]
MTFDNVMTTAFDWVKSIENKYKAQIKTEILEHTDILYRVVFEAEHSLAELIVDNPCFAPYRYVSFLIYSANHSSESEPIFSYYDNETSTIEEIIAQLNNGINVLISH